MDRKMNSPRWLALLLPALALGCSSQDEGAISFKELEAGFSEPSADYRPAPLWVWNGEETREEISASISEMKEAGFGGVFIHPRPGLVTGSLRNLQGPHHNNPPAGIGGPWEWKNIFGPVPAGEKYSLFDYGLYGDISLTASARE